MNRSTLQNAPNSIREEVLNEYEEVIFAHAVLDKKGNFVEGSNELSNLTGFEESLLKGESLSKIMSHNSAVITRHLISTISPSLPSQTTKITLIRVDQVVITMELVMNLYIKNGEEHLFCIFRKQNRDSQLINELQTLTYHYQMLAEHTTHVQILLDKDLKSLYISPSCKMLSGYNVSETRLINLFSLVHPDDFSLFWDQLTYDDKDTEETFRFRFKHKDGHFIPVECQLYKVLDTFGQPDYLILNLYNISKQRNYELELIRAHKEAESAHRIKNNFLTSISHELRTPLNAIIGFSRILDQKTESNENHKFTQYIESSGLELLGLIDNLLEYARIENNEAATPHTKVDIEEFFRDMAPIVRSDLKKFNKENLELIAQWDVNPSLPFIYTSRDVMRHIFTNLLDNAIKFTREGYIRYGCRPYGIRNYLFFVEDSGIGIPANSMELIFEKFTQLDQSLSREYGGTGLGLTVTRRFVDLLGGDIWVISEENKGSSFFFTIPIGFQEE